MVKWIVLFITALLLTLTSEAAAKGMDLPTLSGQELALKQSQDQYSVRLYRDGLYDILRYAHADADLFPREKRSQKRMLSAEQRQELKHIWKRMLDYYLALDSVDLLHRDFLFIEDRKSESFYISYTALLTKYSIALQFLHLTDNDPTFDTIFNEPVPELGLKEDTFAKYKFRYLNVFKAGQFVAYETVKHTFRKPEDAMLLETIEKDREIIWEMGKGTGERLTLKNALTIIADAGSDSIFPVQKGISNWMGKTKVYRKGAYLISDKQIQEMARALQPGDILLERREWHLTNVGIPGFWTHAALFIGTAAERDQFFNKVAVAELLKTGNAASINELIRQKFPSSYQQSLVRTNQGHLPRVAEAISEGVTFTSIEYSAKCDSLAVLRPTVSKADKALAVLRAFKYYGRPYDYNFDFLTDASLVCSELIYKCYESGAEHAGLEFPLERIMGRYMMAPNLLAKEFDAIYGQKDQRYNLVVFLDGDESDNKAYPSGVNRFRKSWKRPKWHIFIQD